jgi:hypothetical protein
MSPTRAISIAPVMKVTLQPDPNFEIVGPNGEEKELGRDMRESWRWFVKPRDGGNFQLIARVDILDAPNGKLIDGYSKRVNVNVRVGTWNGFLNAVGKAKSAGEIFSALFRSWETALISLAALLTALGTVIAGVRALGPKGRKRRAVKREKRADGKAERAKPRE